MKIKFSVIGKKVVRQDGIEKVTGQARYADDYVFSGQLYGVMLRLPIAHAKINKIDYSALIKNPAVTAICDSSDITGSKMIGPIRKDQPIFCNEKIVTPGDVVAMVVGESEDALKDSLKEIKVDYETLPLLTDPLKAMDKEAPLVHPEFKNNLIVHYPLRKGDIAKGFAESDNILEQTYKTQFIEHAYIEPETVTAILLEGEKGVKIIGSIQNPFTTRKVVASVLGWPLVKVRVEQAELGGSFGGKDDTMNILSARAAIAAIKTKRPVKIRYKREESILESYKRHPYVMNYKVGFNNDGKIIAMKIDITADGGAYASMSPFVTWRTVVQATGPYVIPNVTTDVKAVYTNNPYTGAMRGFGSPQPIFAQESIMDEIADRLEMSPDEIRRINGLGQGSKTSSGQKLTNHDVNLIKVLDLAVSKSGFKKKWKQNVKKNLSPVEGITKVFSNAQSAEDLILRNEDFIKPGDFIKRGIGLAVSYRGCSLGAEGIDAAAAYMAVQQDGSLYLLSGLAENGQGLRTTFALIAAEVFGISPKEVHYLELNTGNVADSGPTVASRSTLMGGGAVKNAAEIIRKRLEKILLSHWNIKSKDELVFANSNVYLKSDKRRKIAFSRLCNIAYQCGENLSTVGWYKGPNVHWNESTGEGAAYFTYVYGCQVVEVSVNTGTGEVYIDNIWAVHDPGKVINILGAQGQVYGGVTQGAGYGLWEEIDTKDGFIRELNYDQYLIPTSKDIGNIHCYFIEGDDQYGAWGAKSLGEPTLELTAAAIANAIKNATGKRFHNLPISLEEVLLNRKLRPEDLSRGSTK